MQWMDDELADLRERGLYRERRQIDSGQGVRARYHGKTFLNFASNDYLNLTSDPRLISAARRATRRWGAGAGASALIVGHLPPLRRLERDLAAWQGSEAALVTSSGYGANLAAVSALAHRGDAVFSDELNHASVIDGSRLSRAAVRVYRHGDVYHLKELLRTAGASARRRLILTDSVFSMDGDLAPLPELLELARRHDCLLIVDDAHATGVLGAHGRGAVELLLGDDALAAHADRLVKVGTLSKALGSQGGFVCGSRKVIEYLVNKARPYIFSTALAPPAAAAARRAIAIVAAEPEPRRQLLHLADLLRGKLRAIGLPETSSRCPIVPVIVGEAARAVEMSQRLEEHGLLVPAIRPPSVPEGTSRLRISLTAGHGEEDVLRLVASLERCLGRGGGGG